MNRFTLGIQKNDYKFEVIFTPFDKWERFSTTICDCNVSIVRYHNRFKNPIIRHKNLCYIGAVTSTKNWTMTFYNNNGDDISNLIRMDNGSLYCFDKFVATLNIGFEKNKKKDNTEKTETIDEFDYVELCKECIQYNISLYHKIENKPLFEEELHSYIKSSYSSTDDNLTDNQFFEECKEYFENFILAEKEILDFINNANVDYMLNKYPHLKVITDYYEIIEQVLLSMKNKYLDYYTIFYVKDMIYDIFLFEIREFDSQKFISKYSDRNLLENLLKDEVQILRDKDIVYDKMQSLVNDGEIANEYALVEEAKEIVKQCADFENFYYKLEDCNFSKTIELTDEKQTIFETAETNNYLIGDNLLEYEIYKKISTVYFETLFCKGSTRLKPRFTKLSKCVDFFNKIVQALIENKIIINTENGFVKNDNFDTMDFFNQIKEFCNP